MRISGVHLSQDRGTLNIVVSRSDGDKELEALAIDISRSAPNVQEFRLVGKPTQKVNTPFWYEALRFGPRGSFPPGFPTRYDLELLYSGPAEEVRAAA